MLSLNWRFSKRLTNLLLPFAVHAVAGAVDAIFIYIEAVHVRYAASAAYEERGIPCAGW